MVTLTLILIMWMTLDIAFVAGWWWFRTRGRRLNGVDEHAYVNGLIEIA
jgi:hypothetical protein